MTTFDTFVMTNIISFNEWLQATSKCILNTLTEWGDVYGPFPSYKSSSFIFISHTLHNNTNRPFWRDLKRTWVFFYRSNKIICKVDQAASGSYAKGQMGQQFSVITEIIRCDLRAGV